MSELDFDRPDVLFAAIKPEIEAAYDRHVSTPGRKTVSLDPYALVPIESFPRLKASYERHLDGWASQNVDIQPLIQAVMTVDAATEEGLPWYTPILKSTFEALHEWNGRWTAEEKSHGEIMIRDIEARGILNMSTEWLPVREQNLVIGTHPKLETPADGLAYVTVQELLTNFAHMQSSRIMDAAGTRTLRKLGGDELRHYRFYLAVFQAVGMVAPDIALAAMRRQNEGKNFAMPGQQGIKDYDRLSREIALSGIFDAVTVLMAQKQTIDEAGLLKLSPITDQGKRDQEWAHNVSDEKSRLWVGRKRGMARLREHDAAKAKKIDGLRPFILGHTVNLDSDSNTYFAAA